MKVSSRHLHSSGFATVDQFIDLCLTAHSVANIQTLRDFERHLKTV